MKTRKARRCSTLQ